MKPKTARRPTRTPPKTPRLAPGRSRPAARRATASAPRGAAFARIAADLETQILDRTLKEGDPLPSETALAERYAVHRSTVREAVRRLESAGLVGRLPNTKRLRVTRPGQAATTSSLSRALALDDVTFIELWEAMLAIAPRTAALAAAHPQPGNIEKLEQCIFAVESARSPEGAVAGVVEFFGVLAATSENRVLVLAMQPVTRLLSPSLRRVIDRVPQGRSRIAVAQRCVVEAMRNGHAEEAQAWMTRHVQDFRRGYEVAGIALDTRVSAA